MQEQLNLINSRCAWDCVIKSYDGWSLKISSGTSIENTKPLAEFSGVTYLSCPFEFSHPKFRMASESERGTIESLTPIEKAEYVFAIEAETMAGISGQVYFVVAEAIALSTE